MNSYPLNILLMVLISFAFSLTAKSSPFPGFSSSDAKNYYRVSPWTHKGLTWKISKEDWPLSEYKAPSGLKFENKLTNQVLDIQLLTPNAKSKQQLSAKSFSQFGFSLLGTKLNSSIDIIDLYHHEKQLQVRQYFFKSSRLPMTITCSSGKENFSDTIKKCNKAALQMKLPAEPALKLGSNPGDQTRSTH